MKKLSWSVLLGMLALAAPASAASWTIQGKVTRVSLTDGPNGGASVKMLEITFDTPGNVCNSVSTTLAQIATTESTLFDHWVRQAQTAYLSGRPLVMKTNNASGTCKTWYLEMQ